MGAAKTSTTERIVRIEPGRLPVANTRPVSARTAAVALTFGLQHSESDRTLSPVSLPLEPGRIVLLLGRSGSGKSTALAQIERHCPGGGVVNRIGFSSDAAVIDQVAPWAPLSEAVAFLTACGLGEARCWVRPFHTLSDGEQFRARLARALALHARSPSTVLLLCDEFCSGLHRRLARAISFNLRKLAHRQRLSIVVASSSEDLLGDLQPTVVVRMVGPGLCRIEHRTHRRDRPFSLRRRIRIEPGGKADYDAFAAMHYRATDELGFVDKVFVMRDGAGGEPLGIVVYAHAPLELSLRNRATDDWFSRNPRRVNRFLRILRRLVIHPDVRGCGLGHEMVRKTLPLVGTPFVECLAMMGEFNPVFEKAGMTRIGQYPPSRRRMAAVKELHAMGVDPDEHALAMHVARRRKVREVVCRVVYEWYAGTTGGGAARVQRQSPQFLAQAFRSLVGTRPVYYLWRNGENK